MIYQLDECLPDNSRQSACPVPFHACRNVLPDSEVWKWHGLYVKNYHTSACKGHWTRKQRLVYDTSALTRGHV